MKKKYKILTMATLWVTIPCLYNTIAASPPSVVYDRAPTDDGTMNYFIAGLFNQPAPAFRFATAALPATDGIAYLPYSQRGANFEIMTDDLIRDIEEHGYSKVRIWSISFGDIAATRAESYFHLPEVIERAPELSFVKICPCSRPEFLQPKFRQLLHLIPLTHLGCRLLGPLQFIPCLRDYHEWFSPRLTDDLLHYAAYGDELAVEQADYHSKAKHLIVLAKNDELLDIDVVADFYEGKEGNLILYLPTSHAKTEVDGELFESTIFTYLE